MARTPIWKSIADTLQAEIASGPYRPGDKLPTEAALAARFDVNRHTIRHALKALREGGLVYARRGAGVFVAAQRTDYPLGQRVRFHQTLSSAGRSAQKRPLRVETRTATSNEARALILPDGAPVHVYEGISIADAEPLAVFESIFPAGRFPDLPAALMASGSVTRAFADSGLHDYLRSETRVSAEPANAVQARHLRLSEGAPLLRTTSLNTDLDHAPVEFGRTWFAGDRVVLTVRQDSE